MPNSNPITEPTNPFDTLLRYLPEGDKDTLLDRLLGIIEAKEAYAADMEERIRVLCENVGSQRSELGRLRETIGSLSNSLNSVRGDNDRLIGENRSLAVGTSGLPVAEETSNLHRCQHSACTAPATQGFQGTPERPTLCMFHLSNPNNQVPESVSRLHNRLQSIEVSVAGIRTVVGEFTTHGILNDAEREMISRGRVTSAIRSLGERQGHLPLRERKRIVYAYRVHCINVARR